MNSEQKYSGVIHLAVMLFGFAGLYAKFIEAPSLVIVWGRVIFAAITLYFFAGRRNLDRLSGKDYFKLLLLGILLALHWLSFFESIKLSSVGIGLISFSTFPVFVILYESVFRNYKITRFDLLTILLVLTGIVLIIPDYDFGSNIFSGVLTGLISAVTFAVLTVKNKELVNRINNINLAYYQYFFAAVIITPLVYFTEFTLSSIDIFNLLVLGMVFTAVGHTVYIKSLKFVSSKKAALITCMEPVYGIVFALLLLGEVPGLRVILGGLFIIGTIIFVTLKRT